MDKVHNTFAFGDCRPLTWDKEESRYDLILTVVESGRTISAEISEKRFND